MSLGTGNSELGVGTQGLSTSFGLPVQSQLSDWDPGLGQAYHSLDSEPKMKHLILAGPFIFLSQRAHVVLGTGVDRPASLEGLSMGLDGGHEVSPEVKAARLRRMGPSISVY